MKRQNFATLKDMSFLCWRYWQSIYFGEGAKHFRGRILRGKGQLNTKFFLGVGRFIKDAYWSMMLMKCNLLKALQELKKLIYDIWWHMHLTASNMLFVFWILTATWQVIISGKLKHYHVVLNKNNKYSLRIVMFPILEPIFYMK